MHSNQEEHNSMLFGNEMLLGNGVAAIRNHKIATLVMGYNALILVELKGIQGMLQLSKYMPSSWYGLRGC